MKVNSYKMRFLTFVLTVVLSIHYLTPSVFADDSLEIKTSKERLSAVDLVSITRLSSASQSPDGKFIAFLKRSTDWEEDRHLDQYHLFDRKTGIIRPILSPERKGENFGRAVWSPDSRGFLFQQKQEKIKDGKIGYAKKPSLFVYDVRTKMAKLVVSTDDSVRSPKWSHDGRKIYYISEIENNKSGDKTLKKYRHSIKKYDRPANRALWVFDTVTKVKTPIIAGDFSVSSFNLSADGQSILYAQAPTRLSDDRVFRELFFYDIETQNTQPLTKNNFPEYGQALSPDGTSVAFIATVNEKGEPFYEDNLFIQKKGAKTELILADVPMEILSIIWSADGERIFMNGNIGLTSQIFEYHVADKKLTALTKGNHEIDGWRYNAALDEHIYFKENAQNPGELYLLSSDKIETRITQTFKALNANYATARQVKFTWQGKGRQQLEGLLVYPIGWSDGDTPFPLVTITHGGPQQSSKFGSWTVSRALNVFAGEGYGVFLPNHRGGTGYGDDFMRDMFGGYFRHADDDVMSGIDALIEHGLADPVSLVKQGWSAGGHMTSWLVTQTDRFKAASSGAGASDWVSMYGESDVRYARSFIFGGHPWRKRANLKPFRKDSALYQAHKVNTPTLFWSGEKDIRVPPTQSILMYRAVKATGTPTEYYQAKGEPHNFRKPSHQLFKINTELEWYAKYLRQPYTPSYPLLGESQKRCNDFG